MTTQTYEHRLKAGAKGAPLFIVFHGTGGDENQFFGLAEQLLPDATIVSPRGDVSEYGAARFFRRTGEGVYDMEDLARATDKMAGFIAALAAEYKPSEVIGLGYSNGANIMANLLIEKGRVFDKAALLHPLVPFRPKDNPALEGAKILVTAGRMDPICPPDLTEALAQYFERQKADVELVWHPGGHELRQTELAAVQSLLAY
ncbi:alpha/beta hydrolase [Brucella intermedia]|uniref:Pyrethroid-hydrolyzing carboxylesterase n=2 Tax=Ochrobactrum TaxID=528 RepID=H2ESQ9_9HYPH|nr:MULTISPECIES: alpha/beta hydrolase [Brucella]AEY11370.1 pyrethroid-hydrolyzing carboxylesterase [Ochrobactrum sp. enrichment culture clone YZ-1]MCH6202780.1 alpha/beta hydrolase [Brucella ciceri]BBA73470.1 phospholipase/carboxylesterase [Ochrobactrum sp. PW1]